MIKKNDFVIHKNKTLRVVDIYRSLDGKPVKYILGSDQIIVDADDKDIENIMQLDLKVGDLVDYIGIEALVSNVINIDGTVIEYALDQGEPDQDDKVFVKAINFKFLRKK